MKLVINYSIKDVLNNEQIISAEKEITAEDFKLVKKLFTTLHVYDCIVLGQDDKHNIRMYYDTHYDLEEKILTVEYFEYEGYQTVVKVGRKMTRASVYKLVKSALENGINEERMYLRF